MADSPTLSYYKTGDDDSWNLESYGCIFDRQMAGHFIK